MNNLAKIGIILGISFLTFLFNGGAGFTIAVLLIYFEFFFKKKI